MNLSLNLNLTLKSLRTQHETPRTLRETPRTPRELIAEHRKNFNNETNTT